MKLEKLLNLWEKNKLITNEQNKKIVDFMKERQKENFFRLLKWLSIIGALWFVFGIIVTIINILELDFMQKILEFILETFKALSDFFILYFVMPVYNLLSKVFGEKYPYFLFGILGIFLFILFHIFSLRYTKNKSAEIEKLNLSDEQKYSLTNNFVLDILACLSLSATFGCFTEIIIPQNYYITESAVFPIWNLFGAIVFIGLAYYFSKNLYLLFGIYFVSLCAGMMTGCGYASYWLSVNHPLTQILIAVILLLIGYITELKNEGKDIFKLQKFSSSYYWTGLLILFTALWVASLWGFNFNNNFDYSAAELWIANILFIAISILSMFFGTKYDKKIFFNYGLVFLIIETYTIVFSRFFDIMPVGIASLFLGILMIATVKILKKIYLKRQIKKENKQD